MFQPIIGIDRNAKQGHFEKSQLARISPAIPHLKRASQIHLQFSAVHARNDALESALDWMPWGPIVTDQKKGSPTLTQ